jgi:hypothetical protein
MSTSTPDKQRQGPSEFNLMTGHPGSSQIGKCLDLTLTKIGLHQKMEDLIKVVIKAE